MHACAHTSSLSAMQCLGAAAVAAMLGLAGTNDAASREQTSPQASAAPVLDLTFPSMPSWRHGPVPWPPVARPFDDRAFMLGAGLTSGLRPAFQAAHGVAAAWASLPHEEEAYPNADAMQELSIDPFSIHDGNLRIAATAMPPAAARTLPSDMARPYLSGALNTYPFSQTYGYFEVTARVPSGAGLWPAVWLLPVDQGWPPEIDVAEILGGNARTAYFSLHSTDAAWVRAEAGSYNGSTTTDSSSPGDLSSRFHRYAVNWTPRTITFYLDDVAVAHRTTPADMHKPFYLIVNLAVGGPGSWAGPPDEHTRFPAALDIRSIRIWKQFR